MFVMDYIKPLQETIAVLRSLEKDRMYDGILDGEVHAVKDSTPKNNC